MTTGPNLIVVRHGQTSWNAEQRFQGVADVELDATGRAQADAAANELAHFHVVAVITSDLSRAQQTAAPIASRHHLTPIVVGDLREINVGSWQGLTRPEAQAQFPDEWQAWQAGQDIRRGGGETKQEAGARGAAALTQIMAAYAGDEAVIVVSHGIFIQEALTQLVLAKAVELDLPIPNLDNTEWLSFRPAN